MVRTIRPSRRMRLPDWTGQYRANAVSEPYAICQLYAQVERLRLGQTARPRPLLVLRHAQDLSHGGGALAHLAPAVLAQGAHALAHGEVLDRLGGRMFEDQLTCAFVHQKQLKDAV